MPERVRVGLGADLPADDDGLDLGIAARQLRDERLECLELGVDLDADLLVLLGRDLQERLARLVALVRDDGEAERLSC
jgi:hypothetical protein